MHPCDNTAAPAAVRCTISDDESGSTDCEHVTDDDLGACVYGDDTSDHHPIDDSRDGDSVDHDDDMDGDPCTVISRDMQADAQRICWINETTDARVDASSREPAEPIVVMGNRSMLESLSDTPRDADHGNHSVVLTSSRGRVLKQSRRYDD